jgi:hypothetical protein
MDNQSPSPFERPDKNKDQWRSRPSHPQHHCAAAPAVPEVNQQHLPKHARNLSLQKVCCTEMCSASPSPRTSSFGGISIDIGPSVVNVFSKSFSLDGLFCFGYLSLESIHNLFSSTIALLKNIENTTFIAFKRIQHILVRIFAVTPTSSIPSTRPCHQQTSSQD